MRLRDDHRFLELLFQSKVYGPVHSVRLSPMIALWNHLHNSLHNADDYKIWFRESLKYLFQYADYLRINHPTDYAYFCEHCVWYQLPENPLSSSADLSSEEDHSTPRLPHASINEVTRAFTRIEAMRHTLQKNNLLLHATLLQTLKNRSIFEKISECLVSMFTTAWQWIKALCQWLYRCIFSVQQPAPSDNNTTNSATSPRQQYIDEQVRSATQQAEVDFDEMSDLLYAYNEEFHLLVKQAIRQECPKLPKQVRQYLRTYLEKVANYLDPIDETYYKLSAACDSKQPVSIQEVYDLERKIKRLEASLNQSLSIFQAASAPNIHLPVRPLEQTRVLS